MRGGEVLESNGHRPEVTGGEHEPGAAALSVCRFRINHDAPPAALPRGVVLSARGLYVRVFGL